jgi:hypothetical protein
MKTLQRLGALALLAGGIGLASATTVHVRLTGAQEVPPVKTAATGEAVISVLPNHKVSGEVVTHGVKAFMAHIHEAARGANGPVVIALQHSAAHTWRVPAGAKLTGAEYRAFLAGDLYLNVHSKRHPAGAIRGQIKP